MATQLDPSRGDQKQRLSLKRQKEEVKLDQLLSACQELQRQLMLLRYYHRRLFSQSKQ